MSVLANLEADLGIVETDVVHFFSVTLPNFEQKVAADVEAAASWLVNKALPWMEAHGQEIATDIAGLVGVAATAAAAGVPIPVAVLAAGQTLNTAVAAVNAAIAAAQAASAAKVGSGTVQQAIAAGQAGYASLKAAQQATAAAQSAVALPPSTAPAS